MNEETQTLTFEVSDNQPLQDFGPGQVRPNNS